MVTRIEEDEEIRGKDENEGKDGKLYFRRETRELYSPKRFYTMSPREAGLGGRVGGTARVVGALKVLVLVS